MLISKDQKTGNKNYSPSQASSCFLLILSSSIPIAHIKYWGASWCQGLHNCYASRDRSKPDVSNTLDFHICFEKLNKKYLSLSFHNSINNVVECKKMQTNHCKTDTKLQSTDSRFAWCKEGLVEQHTCVMETVKVRNQMRICDCGSEPIHPATQQVIETIHNALSGQNNFYFHILESNWNVHHNCHSDFRRLPHTMAYVKIDNKEQTNLLGINTLERNVHQTKVNLDMFMCVMPVCLSASRMDWFVSLISHIGAIPFWSNRGTQQDIGHINVVFISDWLQFDPHFACRFMCEVNNATCIEFCDTLWHFECHSLWANTIVYSCWQTMFNPWKGEAEPDQHPECGKTSLETFKSFPFKTNKNWQRARKNTP